MRILSLLVVVLFGTSCVPPSCFDRAYVPAKTIRARGHFASLTLFSQPIEGPIEGRYSAGIGMWERFERGAAVSIDGRGSMAVSGLNRWPQSCPRISREDLGEVARTWQAVFEQMTRPHTNLQFMSNPYTGAFDWRPDGPLLELSVGAASDKSLGILWDGRSSLPEDLDVAVMATLEMVCSNSRLAKTYLLRDLPRQVTSRLECE